MKFSTTIQYSFTEFDLRLMSYIDILPIILWFFVTFFSSVLPVLRSSHETTPTFSGSTPRPVSKPTRSLFVRRQNHVDSTRSFRPFHPRFPFRSPVHRHPPGQRSVSLSHFYTILPSASYRTPGASLQFFILYLIFSSNFHSRFLRSLRSKSHRTKINHSYIFTYFENNANYFMFYIIFILMF